MEIFIQLLNINLKPLSLSLFKLYTKNSVTYILGHQVVQFLGMNTYTQQMTF